jgi:hypothetical protein
LNPSLTSVRGTLTPHSYNRAETKPDLLKVAVSALAEKLAVYDVILGKQKFLGGNVTDVPHPT